MTGHPHTIYKATVAMYDGLYVRAWTEVFTDREVAEAWAVLQTDRCEQREPLDEDAHFDVMYEVEKVSMYDIENFTEDNRELVDEVITVDDNLGGGSA